jgi:hypothetical protein
MASTNGVIFPKSMADFLANSVNTCFGSMPATSTAPAACLIIEGNAVTTNQQIETDLLKKTHPPVRPVLLTGTHRSGTAAAPSSVLRSWLCGSTKEPRGFLVNHQKPRELGVASAHLHS